MKPGLYEFGDAKVYIRESVMARSFTLWLIYKDCIVTMDDGSMIMEKMEEGVELDPDDAFMTWEDTQDITANIFEVFNALAVAMGGGTRSADDAYERGRLEGENKILKEWNQSLASVTTTPAPFKVGSRPNTTNPWTIGDSTSPPYATFPAINYNSWCDEVLSTSTTKELDLTSVTES